MTAKESLDPVISAPMHRAMEAASFIRQMFEEGNRLRAELGDDAVFDFSLGNPCAPPPESFFSALRTVAGESSPADHRYMTNAGRPDVRQWLARRLSAEHELDITADHVVMTCGAAGGLNVLLKSVLEPQDEVLLLTPYFTEYLFYIQNHGGIPKAVPTQKSFQPDPEAFRRALGPKTRAVIVNTPNNPSGVVYEPALVEELGRLVDEHSERMGRPVYLFMDEPYRRIRYVDTPHPSALLVSRNGIIVTSFSKELGLAGERIGYVVLNPRIEGVEVLFGALGIATRILGFVNAPAFMQRIIPHCAGSTVDLSLYRKNREILIDGLTRAGYEMPSPDGAFFLFPKAPGGDDRTFCDALKKQCVLTVPGSGFGAPGHFRISYAVPTERVEKAIPLFARAIDEFSD